MKIRKKPITFDAEQLTQKQVEAHLFDNAPLPKGVRVTSANYHPKNRTISTVTMRTLGNNHIANVGDWIIKGTDGNFSACDQEVFSEMYEVVE